MPFKVRGPRLLRFEPMLRLFLLASLAASLAAGVPLPKHAAHGTGKRAPASTAAAEADLITDLPGAPKDVAFKQYAGEMVT